MRRNRGWIWFFVVLTVLAVAAVAINWTYNVRQQLTPEQLKTASDLWAKNGPADYDLLIEKAYSSAYSDGETRERIQVKVRNRNVVSARFEGAKDEIPPTARDEYDMPS